ncbi:MAG TPA: hypothetical protein VJ300_01280 [Thermoplasmata archaeon]|nr:hypothetical protein [Thermoplasmata archaeon]
MAGMGERLWEIGRSPPHHITVLAFGLVALLTGLIVASTLVVVGPIAAFVMAATVLTGVGVFFVALALFLGSYTSSGDTVTGVVWRVAQLLAAVLVLLALI